MRQRLSLLAAGRPWGDLPRSEPDSGNPTVRDRREACGNVAVMGVGLRPTGKPLESPPNPTPVRASHFYPDHRCIFPCRSRAHAIQSTVAAPSPPAQSWVVSITSTLSCRSRREGDHRFCGGQASTSSNTLRSSALIAGAGRANVRRSVRIRFPVTTATAPALDPTSHAASWTSTTSRFPRISRAVST
jgi:hypothetical protein